MIRRFTDPTSPGTRAWQSADNAIAVWRKWRPTGRPTTDRLYTSYRNYVHSMVQELRKHGKTADEIQSWKVFIGKAKTDPDFTD